MTPGPATFPGYRFPAAIISYAVWLYHVFGLSLREVELLLAERGIVVTHESIRQWCRKFGAGFQLVELVALLHRKTDWIRDHRCHLLLDPKAC